MAIPVLKLNLAPPPTFWRRQHAVTGWAILSLGVLALAMVGGFTWRAYRQADQVGRDTFRLSKQTQDSITRQGNIQNQLKAINVQKELPRWRLAERILVERCSPWSRLTAELERSLVQDVRIRGLQRSRSSDQQVILKVKGEARTREAEANFVDSIQKNRFFAQMVLERESERQGGGIEFEFTLPLSASPPPYAPLPKFGPAPKPVSLKSPTHEPAKPKAIASSAPGMGAKPARSSAPEAPIQPVVTRPSDDSGDPGLRRRPRRAVNRPNQEGER